MRVVLLSSNRGRWSAKGQNHTTENGVEAWVYAFEGDYIGYDEVTPKDIQQYDLVIANTNHIGINYLPKILSLAEARPKSVKWVSLIEGSATDYLKPMPFIRRVLDASDFVNVINRHTLSFFQALTSTPCEYIGIPYPIDTIIKLRVPIEKRLRRAFICPMLPKRWNDYLVAKNLGVEFYGYERRISRKLSTIKETWLLHRSLNANKYFEFVQSVYADDALTIRREVGIAQYLTDNASALLWINLDDRFTWGRYVLDAAALHVPIITTRCTGHAEDLFPHTTLEHEFQIKEAIELGKRLLSDEAFYKMVAEVPEEKLEQFRSDTLKEKLLSQIC
jgi:hypothetical protein